MDVRRAITIKNQLTSATATVEKIHFDKPTVEDGAAMWELVNRSTLDQNSAYKYIMMCEFFAETCVVAKEGDTLVGFITAFIPPERQDAVFVWQIGVDASQRGKGLASKMLQELIERQNKAISYVEATITPSNEASQALFRRLARTYQTRCEVTECFSEDLFPGDHHEKELSFRIGPIEKNLQK